MAESEFDRGHAAGGIEARLAGHDKHFAAINGSLGDIAKELNKMTLAVQRLGDQADANAKTVVSTASALKAAEDARRAKAVQAWSPVQKILAVIAAVATVTSLVLAVIR